ncbi:unnamed protein product [Laminaria digitata]
MDEKLAKLAAMTRHIRRCFQEMSAVVDQLHSDLGVTASMRAVLEHLVEMGEQTVPQIASSKNVSRQHIQQNANALEEKELITFRDNPAHKRSQLLQMTDKGKQTFATIRSREMTHFGAIAEAFSVDELDMASAVLESFRSRLAEEGETRWGS